MSASYGLSDITEQNCDQVLLHIGTHTAKHLVQSTLFRVLGGMIDYAVHSTPAVDLRVRLSVL